MKKKLFFACFLHAGISMPATAQEKKEYTNFSDTTFLLHEVIVETTIQKKTTSLKLDVPVKFLPVTSSVVDASILELYGIRDIQSAGKFLPGIRVQTSYGGFQQISARGFDHIPVLIDGMRDERTAISNSYPFMDLSAVESIEYLKGPASVLYGNSAVGGLLNVVRKQPTAKKSVHARVAYGSYNNKQATLGMGGRLLEGVNSYFSVNMSDADGWRENAAKRFSGYSAIDIKTGSKGVLDLRGGFNRDHYATEIGLPKLMNNTIYNADGTLAYSKLDILPGLDRKARYNNESDYLKNNAWNIAATYTYKFNDAIQVKERFSYFDDDIDYFSTEELNYLTSSDPIYRHYYLKDEKDKIYICLDTVTLNSPLRFQHLNKTTSNQLELSGKFHTAGIRHNYVGGYSFTYIDRISYTGYQLGSDVTGPGLYSKVPVYNPHSMGYMETRFSYANIYRNYLHGVYFQDLIEFNEKIKVLLAGRYDHFNLQYVRTNANDGKSNADIPPKDAFARILNNSFTYRAGLVYLPTPDISIYGSMSSFFQPYRTFFSEKTIYVDRNGNEYTPNQRGEVFKPQTGYQAEAGARYTWKNLLSIEGSFFFIRKNNVNKTLKTDVEVSHGDDIVLKSVVGQLGRIDSKGFDIEIRLNPVNGFSAFTGYTFTDSKTGEIASNPWMATDPDKGNRFTYIPKNTFFAGAQWFAGKGILNGAGIHLDFTYNDKVYRTIADDFYFPSYWLLDLGATYRLKNNVTLSFQINNLFNKSYYNESLGKQIVPAMPRNYLGSITYTL